MGSGALPLSRCVSGFSELKEVLEQVKEWAFGCHRLGASSCPFSCDQCLHVCIEDLAVGGSELAGEDVDRVDLGVKKDVSAAASRRIISVTIWVQKVSSALGLR